MTTYIKQTALIFGLAAFGFTACQEKDTNTVVWAGEVQAKTEVYKQEYYDDNYWSAINKDVNYDTIFNEIVDEVLAGNKVAYSILTEEPLSIDEVKEKLAMSPMEGEELVPIEAKDLSAIRMRESWHFNESDFTLEKKVTRIGFLLTKLDYETGQYLGDGALFYVNMGRD